MRAGFEDAASLEGQYSKFDKISARACLDRGRNTAGQSGCAAMERFEFLKDIVPEAPRILRNTGETVHFERAGSIEASEKKPRPRGPMLESFFVFCYHVAKRCLKERRDKKEHGRRSGQAGEELYRKGMVT